MAKRGKKVPSRPKKIVKARTPKRKALKAKSKVKASPRKEVPPQEVEAATPARLAILATEHLLTMSFLRDEGEFCVRLEKSTGNMTELKNRSPDLLLRMVQGELEDLLG